MLDKFRDHREFDDFRNMDLHQAGMSIMYYTNPRKYSFKAALTFSEYQIRSAGAWIFYAEPRWNKMDWKNPNRKLISDSITFNLLTANPQWIGLNVGPGYTYNLSWKSGHWILAPAIFSGVGVLKEINNAQPYKPSFFLRNRLNFGYNGFRFYAFILSYYDYGNSELITNDWRSNNYGVSLLIGYRFYTLKNKILGLI